MDLERGISPRIFSGQIYLPNIQLGGTELFMSQILIAKTAIKTLLLIAIFFLQL